MVDEGALTCAEVFERMGEKYEELGLRDIHGVFQFNIHGPDGGQWYAVCRGDTCRTYAGRHERPDVTIRARSDHVVKMAEGRMAILPALAMGRVKISGNMRLLARVRKKLIGF